jgi:hypothetical protein
MRQGPSLPLTSNAINRPVRPGPATHFFVGWLILALLNHAPPPDPAPLTLHPAVRKTRAVVPAPFADRQLLAIDHYFPASLRISATHLFDPDRIRSNLRVGMNSKHFDYGFIVN